MSPHRQRRYNLPAILNRQQILDSEMTSLAAERVIQSLKEARYLTISQIAELFYATKADGQPANVQMARPRLGEEYPTVPGYHSARKLIKAMEARGQVILSTYRSEEHTSEIH